ncbi:MAG TPA: HAMP domain-containing sensor histidine kinase [Elusimicrobiota bacterium]|nr:HAMP domain-containing sensor histidine kinase [Elusimicrobiota bacterium]
MLYERPMDMNAVHHESVQSVVHDLRTPMTVIKAYLRMLMSGMMGDLTPAQMEVLQRSMSPLDDLILMTENLLQAADLDKDASTLHCAETDLDHLLTDMIDFYQLPFKQRNMMIQRDGNTLGQKLYIDAFWMKRVLQNLIWNAYKFTPDRGRVNLEVNLVNGGIEIAVVDNGRGIPPESIQKIFHKNQQVSQVTDRKQGNGLGLWICKRVMELHDGDVRVESSYGLGSRFVLFFPANRIL